MRTTLDIEDEVLEEIKQYASARSISAGKAISYLAKRGLTRPLGTRMEDGFEIFDVPEDSPIITQEHVQRLIDEL